jgi:outer membrane lipoprotein-sorting protein
MAPYESDGNTGAEELEDTPSGRRMAARYAVPVAVVGVAAATIGLVPALADSGDPNLPKISAQQLIEKIAKSDVQQLSGTVKVSADLGLPDLGGLENSIAPGGSRSGGGASADPSSKLTELVTGTHTLRVASDGADKKKISLIENAAEYSLIRNGKDVWGYDSKSNEVYHSAAAPQGEDGHRQDHRREAHGKSDMPATPRDFAGEALKAVDGTTSVTVDGTERIAGRDAYKLLIKPKQSGTTVGAISIAVDSKTGMPLKFTLTPSSGGAAVLDVGFTQVSFARPAASTFDFTPPKGAKVTQGGDKASGHEGYRQHKDFKGPKDLKGFKGSRGPELRHGAPFAKGDHGKGFHVLGQGWNAIAVLDTGAKGGMPSGAPGGDMSGLLGSFGDKVTGKFGKGTVVSTRLINALITDDGKVYVGAVDKSALVKAADQGK